MTAHRREMLRWALSVIRTMVGLVLHSLTEGVVVLSGIKAARL